MIFSRFLFACCHRSACWLLLVWLSACSLTPDQRLEHQARMLGFDKRVVAGNAFAHVLFLPHPQRRGSRVHIYLEGDGLPWEQPRRVARDPTPGNPLMLRLMARDRAPSLYLGRPCYHGLASLTPCHPGLWTYGRYSQTVVDSMAQVLKRELEQGGYEEAVLLGYSGGGTLAMLLAERLPRIRAVLTLNGNLDPDAWTAFHGFTPLWTSLNPAKRPPLPSRIYQLHLLSGRDSITPPGMITTALAKQRRLTLWSIDEFDHRCCWEQLWPWVLAYLDNQIGEQ